jgi:Arm domain-containing DNA-binding protein/integrase-like protein
MASRSAQNELLASDEFVGYMRAYQQPFCRDTNMPLTDTAVRNAKGREKPQKLSDGGGLHLLVNPDGARYWRMAYRYQGRQKTLALGVYPIVSLADARTAQDAAKKLLACDVDPSQARKEQKRAGRLSAENTFEIVAREWCKNQKDGWTARYHDHVVTRLEADVFPEIGSRPIADTSRPNCWRFYAKSKSAARSKSRSGCSRRSAKSSDTASSRAGRSATPPLT